MSIRPLDMSGPLWQVIHDDPGYGHLGEIDPSTINYTENLDGSPNFDFLLLNCPIENCNSSSTWPVGGGATALPAQEMFVRIAVLKGSPPKLAIEDVRARCNAMDGEGRWQIDEDKLLKELDAAP